MRWYRPSSRMPWYLMAVALALTAAELDRRTGTSSTVEAEPGLRLDANRETVLYRVVQEALTNVTKHASANAVPITVGVEGNTARLEVADDGVGFDPPGCGAWTATTSAWR